jgi:hypothetical protein
MARLVMLSGNIGGYSDMTNHVNTVIHPRTERPVQGFGLRKIILWNTTGTIGGAITGLGSDNTMGTYGILELYDEYNADLTNLNAASSVNRKMRIPVSGKSRLVIDLPGDGMYFREGIRVAVGPDADDNEGDYMYYQLIGYEY